MNKNIINALLSEINTLILQVQDKKNKIQMLQTENTKKNNLNYDKYISRIKELDKTEQSIKNLMENKYFKYIKHIDFTNYHYVDSLDGFSVDENIGCVLKSEETRKPIGYSNRFISSDNKKITYIYENNPEISNVLEYSFYSSQTGAPLIPSSIKITYKDNEDNFYEPHFRFYNRNNKDSFVNSFPFQPKKISKIIFDFNEEVNSYNAQCTLYSITYSMLDNNYIIFEIPNYEGLGNFTINKKSEESFVPLSFFYSEDNIEYKLLNFNENSEALIMLNNNGNFFIKVCSNNEEIKIKEEKNIKTKELYSKELENSFGVYSIPNNTTSNLNDLKITFSLSTYNNIKSSFEKLEGVSIDDFIQVNNNGIYTLKNEYIFQINEVNEEINKLKYIDDISILKTDKKYFNVYVDSKNMKIHFSSFMEDFNFFIEVQYQDNENTIDRSYYTPYLFSLSLKG